MLQEDILPDFPKNQKDGDKFGLVIGLCFWPVLKTGIIFAQFSVSPYPSQSWLRGALQWHQPALPVAWPSLEMRDGLRELLVKLTDEVSVSNSNGLSVPLVLMFLQISWKQYKILLHLPQESFLQAFSFRDQPCWIQTTWTIAEES